MAVEGKARGALQWYGQESNILVTSKKPDKDMLVA